MLTRTSKLTGLYNSGDDGLTIVWGFFNISISCSWKSLLKLDNGKFSDCWYSMGRHKKNIGIFVKAPHSLVLLYLTTILAKFRKNPINLHTLLIHLNRGDSRKNKPRVFYLARKKFTVFARHWRGYLTLPCRQPVKRDLEFPGVSWRRALQEGFPGMVHCLCSQGSIQ